MVNMHCVITWQIVINGRMRKERNVMLRKMLRQRKRKVKSKSKSEYSYNYNYNPWAICEAQAKKHGWSKNKTERCIKKVKKKAKTV